MWSLNAKTYCPLFGGFHPLSCFRERRGPTYWPAPQGTTRSPVREPCVLPGLPGKLLTHGLRVAQTYVEVPFLALFAMMILLITDTVSWLVAFDIVNERNDVARSVVYALSALTDPMLNPLRKVIPPVGGLDLTFLVQLLLDSS
jgi:uncharacterized protein YggT (Ycf19 family)